VKSLRAKVKDCEKRDKAPPKGAAAGGKVPIGVGSATAAAGNAAQPDSRPSSSSSTATSSRPPSSSSGHDLDGIMNDVDAEAIEALLKRNRESLDDLRREIAEMGGLDGERIEVVGRESTEN
jgi:hypothetical protein